MSFKLGITTEHDHEFIFNSLRFEQGGSAFAYGKSLKLRWPTVVEFIVKSSMDPVNCQYPVPSDRFMLRQRQQREGFGVRDNEVRFANAPAAK